MRDDIHWCPNCDHGLEVDSPEVAAEAIVTQADVQIAKIQADRDIALAKIQAKIYTEEIAVEAATAEARNDVLEDVVENLTAPDQEVVVMPSGQPEAEPEAVEEDMAEAPPEVEPEPAPRKSKSAWSYWG